MFAALLITLREGLEAALIVGIILAYLARTGNRRQFGAVWLGAGAAVAVSLLAGGAIFLTVGELEGRAEQVFEGAAMLTAAVVITWMVFWMRQQSANIRAHLQAQLDAALRGGSALALALVAFVAVVREGIETALFLFGAVQAAASPLASAIGSLAGLSLAVLLGYALYRGTRRLNLRAFFGVTSAFLILFAAGMLAHGIHEFEEAGLIPIVIEHVWDINGILPEKSDLGRFLTTLVGYNGNPSLVEVIAYLGYLAAGLWYYFRPVEARSARVVRHQG